MSISQFSLLFNYFSITQANFISIVKQKPVKAREVAPKKNKINTEMISSLLRVAQGNNVKILDERKVSPLH